MQENDSTLLEGKPPSCSVLHGILEEGSQFST
ncbi:MAG: hypothetical protein JWN42_1142, partial [Candidatus Angelobacter sp.]|nr:hypothetical protein [Candidatus Angelobacter sp.]